MKKRTWIKGWFFSFLCLTLLGCVACQGGQDSSVDSMENSESSSSIIIPTDAYTGIHTINGFENNDDLYRIKQKQVNIDVVFDMRISNE